VSPLRIAQSKPAVSVSNGPRNDFDLGFVENLAEDFSGNAGSGKTSGRLLRIKLGLYLIKARCYFCHRRDVASLQRLTRRGEVLIRRNEARLYGLKLRNRVLMSFLEIRYS
jgi:hypothetical protein